LNDRVKLIFFGAGDVQWVFSEKNPKEDDDFFLEKKILKKTFG